MNKNEFFSRINKSTRPVVVDLWAPWCVPCKAMQPAFKQVGQKYADEVFVFKINADESPDVIRALGVRGIPTVIGFAHGKEIVRRTGLQSAQALEVIFDSTVKGRKPAAMPLTPITRILRLVGGLALLAAGWLMGHSILLFILGGVLLFSAVYDRCPIYRAIVPRLAALIHKG
jgi:thioredoxin